MPTIKDVAKEAGVSIATVSYVLNNKTHLVGKDTRQEVLDAIKRVGYTPNITARNLKASQTRLIGYAWHRVPNDETNPLLDGFAYFLAQAAEAVNYHLLTFTHADDDPIPVYNEMIRTQRVDGFVLSGTVADDARIRFLTNEGFPFVSFGRSNPGWAFNWVDTDGKVGVQTAVEYLISLGHQRIAMVAWPEESVTGNYRLYGYIEAMQAAGLPVHDGYLQRGENEETAGANALNQWLQLPNDIRPTAAIAITDIVAIGLMREAERQGVQIPTDFSVIGFDDAPMSQYVHPALTTLRQAIPQTGQALMTILEALLNKTEPKEAHILITPRLILRETCAPPLR
ncbi:MAG: LacI family DNA-binding transcriptional regulator [Chloroflexi bacterium]|nr:LacI family DNA-binding transcriptional regulator [Chloroflexota bacterium]MCC6891641.1 LacI family DNA-binding transcriptional regulator [Anaerolineae bacterium]